MRGAFAKGPWPCLPDCLGRYAVEVDGITVMKPRFILVIPAYRETKRLLPFLQGVDKGNVHRDVVQFPREWLKQVVAMSPSGAPLRPTPPPSSV